MVGKMPDGNFHCYNKVGDAVFDLTSEQLGDETLVYNLTNLQIKEKHFAKQEKYERYLKLKKDLSVYCRK